jgi:hypothetical protein
LTWKTWLSKKRSFQARAACWCEASAISSCSRRVMPFSFAIFSAESPIVWPVEYSAIAGGTGIRSLGESF